MDGRYQNYDHNEDSWQYDYLSQKISSCQKTTLDSENAEIDHS